MGDFVRSLPDAAAIGATINVAGVAILGATMGLPFSVPVTGTYLLIGTLVGAGWFPGKAALERAAASLSGEGRPMVMVGEPKRDAELRFTGANLFLLANEQELKGRPSEARKYSLGRSNALDTWLKRTISPQDLKRLTSVSEGDVQRLSEAWKIPATSVEALVAQLRKDRTPETQLKALAGFFQKNGVRGLGPVLQIFEAGALNAQEPLLQHLSDTYGAEFSRAVLDAITNTGAKPGIQHPVSARVAIHPSVAQELARMASEPDSGVGLDARRCPVLTDRTKAASVLVRLANAHPPEAGLDCALLVDGANNDRIYFGASQGHDLDAISSAIMFAGSGRKEEHLDKTTLDFLHPKSVVWSLGKAPLGLATAHWSDVKEVHHLLDSQEVSGAAFKQPKFELFPPGHPAHAEIPGFAELQETAKQIRAGAPSVRAASASDSASDSAATAQAPEIHWPAHGSLLLDDVVLRVAEVFGRSPRTKGRVSDEGKIFIADPKTGASYDEGLKIAADFALTISAIARTDSGQDAGGPFGTVVWHPRTGEATVGKNQVVPGKSPVLHGERVGLLLSPELLSPENGERAIVVTSAEPCAMCYGACDASKKDIAFVATTRGVEANTPFKEGEKDWSEFHGVAYGPENYPGKAGQPVVLHKKVLADRAELAEQILAGWTKNGEDYSV